VTPATVRGMPNSTEGDRGRQREAVEREMQRRRARDEREGRELVDTVGEEQQQQRERARERGGTEEQDED